MANKIIPLEIEGINDKIYSGFWSRLGANLLDGLIIIPFSLMILFINSFNIYIYFFTIVPNLLFAFWYHVFLPKKYGGTPGKLIVGIKIIKIDSSPIGWKESFLRYIVTLFLSLVTIFFIIIAIFSVDTEIYNNLNWFQKSAYLSNLAETNGINILTNIWFWSELIVLLFNKRKRAIHDFIAGTVVLKSEYVDKIREKTNELNKIDCQV
jgi:uncharacterized RDD family membrane protein YckC